MSLSEIFPSVLWSSSLKQQKALICQVKYLTHCLTFFPLRKLRSPTNKSHIMMLYYDKNQAWPHRQYAAQAEWHLGEDESACGSGCRLPPSPVPLTAAVILGTEIASPPATRPCPALKSSTFAKLQTDATQVPANNLPRPISKGRFQNMRESLEGVLFQR